MNSAEMDILVVDDARFSAAVVNRTLAAAGYTNIRHANSAQDALGQLAQQPADLVVADWLMPGMDGLELTRRIRQNDEASNRYTYVLLLTAREGVDALQQAFDQGVDDFVSKSSMTEQLQHRVMAADRIVQRHNRVQADYQRMLAFNRQLKRQALIDPLTGFGNRLDSMRALQNTLKQAERRGGAACLILLRLEEFEAQQKERGQKVMQQGVLAFSRRLRQSVRPLDSLCRIQPDLFALVTWQPHLNHCEPSGFRRLYETLNHRAYQTAAGFISLHVSMALTASEGTTPAEKMFDQAGAELSLSVSEKRIVSATSNA
ncbi:response regulator with GGDEF domain [Alcanivorax nanhaiticus]|uniref:Response regulator with GGDEF domain n=1 Tax=Alcanivorax nanhaiticus TaxID=1177154 RepID=A0A095TSQ5_9GAMM|nr:response regulator [Alcanivorax nanhaiticus]KGD65438.1 response regulator with GGDEF domain [Alcanivorax nanhaiticus]